jgi:hypothetical protein
MDFPRQNPKGNLMNDIKKTYGRLSCVKVAQEERHYQDFYGDPRRLVKDVWFITTDSMSKIHLENKTKEVTQGVPIAELPSEISERAADFFIEHPNAKWLILEAGTSGGYWSSTVIAWSE